MHSGMRPRKGTLTFHGIVVLTLLATTLGAADREWDREE